MSRPSPLVSAAWLASHLADDGVIVADVRWYLKGRSGKAEYIAGHLPGAIFVDADRDLASPPGSGPGRHPLPTASDFAEFLARIGAGPRHVIVGYDDQGGAVAARLWWLLRYFGHDGGRVLDGGIQAWIAQGSSLETAVAARPAAPRMQLEGRTEMVVDRRRVADLSRAGALLLDARAPERYEGKTEPVDARAGHIPGAKNAPVAGNLLEAGGRFRTPDELTAQYGAVGALDSSSVVAYCGSGLTACHDLLALELAGRSDALLYEGSWSDWSSDPALPAATGKE